MKKITLSDFLTEKEILKVIELNDAKKICDEIIRPNIEKINKKLGQANDPMFLGYACAFVSADFWKRGAH